MTDLRGKTGAELTALMHDDNEVVREAVEMKVTADVFFLLACNRGTRDMKRLGMPTPRTTKIMADAMDHKLQCTGRVAGAKAAVSAMEKK